MNFQTQDPRTGQILETYSYHAPSEVKEFLAKLSQQQNFWRQLTVSQRIEQLQRVQNKLEGLKEALALQMSAEMGKSLAEARAECEKALTVFPYYEKIAVEALKNRSVVSGHYDHAEIVFEPLGIVFAIMPWNFPVWQVLRFAVPALLSGNLILLKHSEITAGTAKILEDVFVTPDFQLLKNVFVSHEDAAQVIRDHRVSAVTLTGSTRAGEAVASLAGAALKKTVLELGGNDAYLVFEDADLEHAARILTRSRLQNGGQSCIAAKRFFVHSAVKDQFLSLLRSEFQKMKPVVLAHLRFRDQVVSQTQRLKLAGAELIYEGTEPPQFGAYVSPVIFLKSKEVVWDEEIFGPVAIVSVFETEDEALYLANQSLYGLGGGVFTKNQTRAERVLANLEAGFVASNDVVRSEAALPFGGQKKSGFGRELGEAGLFEFVQVKTQVYGEFR